MLKSIAASKRADIGHLTIRDLRRTFVTRLYEMNYSSGVTAKLLGPTDNRSVHRYERVSNILRKAVSNLENANRAISQKGKTKNWGKLLKTNGGDEEGRTPDLCIANAALCQTELHPHNEI